MPKKCRWEEEQTPNRCQIDVKVMPNMQTILGERRDATKRGGERGRRQARQDRQGSTDCLHFIVSHL